MTLSQALSTLALQFRCSPADCMAYLRKTYGREGQSDLEIMRHYIELHGMPDIAEELSE